MVGLDLSTRLAEVHGVIAERQRIGGWDHPVRIVAVTKTHPPEMVRAAVAAGVTIVGENRVQEALMKQEALPDVPVEWHLIGSLQRNKVRKIIGRFALIHSVDRMSLAEEIAGRMDVGARQAVLLEVNCSDEPQKSGVEPDGLLPLLEGIASLPGVVVRGLMTMAPLTEDVAVQRAAFHRLRDIRDVMERQGHPLPELSMGMSGDYPTAVEEGATMVRLGTLLFGERA